MCVVVVTVPTRTRAACDRSADAILVVPVLDVSPSSTSSTISLDARSGREVVESRSIQPLEGSSLTGAARAESAVDGLVDAPDGELVLRARAGDDDSLEHPIRVSGMGRSADVRWLAILLVALAAGLAACALPWSAPEPAGPDPMDIVRIAPREPSGEDDDDDDRPFDPQQMERNLARRFPGVSAIDFMRVLIASDSRAGRCWTHVSRLWKTDIDIDYSIDGEKRSASGIQGLKKQDWWPIYRSPEGHGFERRAGFDSIDLRVGTRVGCHCAAREGRTDGDSIPLELRFRWEKGKMPEVSAGVTEDGRRRGLSPTVTYGHFLTYDFEAKGSFPAESGGVCGAHVILSILNDPPIV